MQIRQPSTCKRGPALVHDLAFACGWEWVSEARRPRPRSRRTLARRAGDGRRLVRSACKRCSTCLRVQRNANVPRRFSFVRSLPPYRPVDSNTGGTYSSNFRFHPTLLAGGRFLDLRVDRRGAVMGVRCRQQPEATASRGLTRTLTLSDNWGELVLDLMKSATFAENVARMLAAHGSRA
jgi:hypothetical protein